jgi:hypothetical protein
MGIVLRVAKRSTGKWAMLDRNFAEAVPGWSPTVWPVSFKGLLLGNAE